jgi:photosystem II stability/assembly factor-like uncharacterized protein
MATKRLILTQCLSILCLVSCVFSLGCFGLPPDPEPPEDVQFVSSQIGFILGPGGYLLKTLDGGQTWSALDKRSDKRGGRIDFVDSDHGWRLFAFELLRTTDGGLTWQTQLRAEPYHSFDGLHFVDRMIGWITGYHEPRRQQGSDEWIPGRRKIWHTSDGGATWEEQAKSTEFPDLNDICFVNAQCGWCVGRHGAILRTCDAGRTWEKINIGEQYYLRGVQFVSETEGWAVGNNAIFHSSDGGKTWNIQATLDTEAISVHFSNQEKGWVVGFDGLILHTSDGGRTWIRQQSGTKMHFKSVWFINENTGWAVGGWEVGDRYEDESGKPREGWFEGIILRTVNGGQTWERVEPPIKRRRWF